MLINHQILFFNQRTCPNWVSNHKNHIDCKKRLSVNQYLRKSIKDDLICHEKKWTSAQTCRYNSMFYSSRKHRFYIFGSHSLRLYEYLPDTCRMENANANVKRIDIMLLKEFKNIVKNDENIAAVFSICVEHYSRARKRDLEFSLNSFHLFLASF